MSALENDGLHHTYMKKRELEVESYIENVCRRSCADAIHKEIELQKENYR
jgi:hypothetical protein